MAPLLGHKHAGMSMCVTDASPREVAEALAKIGLSAGQRPQAAGDDRILPPKGQAVEIALVVAGARDPTLRRVPAAGLFSMKAGGEPLAAGAWVYVGPQVVRDGDAEVSVTDLSGSLVTTSLRDSSAMIYWVPANFDTAAPYDAAFYASRERRRPARPPSWRSGPCRNPEQELIAAAQSCGSDRGVGSRCR